MQFELFEKQPSANNFQIEREKSYDYPLVIYKKKRLCLNAFRSRLDVVVWLRNNSKPFRGALTID